MIIQIEFLIWIWSIAWIPSVLFGIPSLFLYMISIVLENAVILRDLSTGLDDLPPTKTAIQQGRFKEWCIKSYDQNNRKYDIFVNIFLVLKYLVHSVYNASRV
jgi:hypothetical protein